MHGAHASRIMKLVAQTSSSRMRQVAPSSRASWMLAAWLVLPLASGELKLLVSFPAQHALPQPSEPSSRPDIGLQSLWPSIEITSPVHAISGQFWKRRRVSQGPPMSCIPADPHVREGWRG